MKITNITLRRSALTREGRAGGKQTVSLFLQRRYVRIDQIRYIGKESNSLEEVEVGLIHSPQNVYTEYPDAKRDEWKLEDSA